MDHHDEQDDAGGKYDQASDVARVSRLTCSTGRPREERAVDRRGVRARPRVGCTGQQQQDAPPGGCRARAHATSARNATPSATKMIATAVWTVPVTELRSAKFGARRGDLLFGGVERIESGLEWTGDCRGRARERA